MDCPGFCSIIYSNMQLEKKNQSLDAFWSNVLEQKGGKSELVCQIIPS